MSGTTSISQCSKSCLSFSALSSSCLLSFHRHPSGALSYVTVSFWPVQLVLWSWAPRLCCQDWLNSLATESGSQHLCAGCSPCDLSSSAWPCHSAPWPVIRFYKCLSNPPGYLTKSPIPHLFCSPVQSETATPILPGEGHLPFFLFHVRALKMVSC